MNKIAKANRFAKRHTSIGGKSMPKQKSGVKHDTPPVEKRTDVLGKTATKMSKSFAVGRASQAAKWERYGGRV